MKDYIKRHWVRIFVALILLSIGLYSAAQLVHYVVSSFSARRTNEELQAEFESAEEIPDPSTTAMETMVTPTATPEPQLLDSYQYIGDTIIRSSKR